MTVVIIYVNFASENNISSLIIEIQHICAYKVSAGYDAHRK